MSSERLQNLDKSNKNERDRNIHVSDDDLIRSASKRTKNPLIGSKIIRTKEKNIFRNRKKHIKLTNSRVSQNNKKRRLIQHIKQSYIYIIGK